MSLISPAEAVRQFNVSKPTLYKDMEDGKLSYKLDDRGKRKIDIAELQRLYELRSTQTEKKASNNVKPDPEITKVDVKQDMVPKSELLEKEVEMLKSQLSSKEDEIEHWKEAHDKAQTTAQKITLLLEDHTNKQDKNSEWSNSLKALENRIANQEQAAKERKELEKKLEEENDKLKKAYKAQKQKLQDEQSKTWWQKLTGS